MVIKSLFFYRQTPIVQLFFLTKTEMQKQKELAKVVERILYMRGFYTMDDFRRDRAFQLLELSFSQDSTNIGSKIIDAFIRIIKKERVIKPIYFDQPKHLLCPLQIKMFISDIITEAIKTPIHPISPGVKQQDQLKRAHYPFYSYPLFPMPLYPQHHPNPITQQNSAFEDKRFKIPKYNPFEGIFPDSPPQIYLPPHMVSKNNVPPSKPQMKNEEKSQRKQEKDQLFSVIDDGLNPPRSSNINSSDIVSEVKVQEKKVVEVLENLEKVKKKKKGKKSKKMISFQMQTDVSCFKNAFKNVLKTHKIRKDQKTPYLQFKGPKKNQLISESSYMSSEDVVINSQISKKQSKDQKNNKTFLRPLNKNQLQHQISNHKLNNNQKEMVNKIIFDEEILDHCQKEKEKQKQNPYQVFDQVSHSHEINLSHSMPIEEDFQEGSLEQAVVSSNGPILEKCLCNGAINNSDTFSCERCQSVFHYECFNGLSKECPICMIRGIEMYEPVEKVIKECYFRNINNNKFQTTLNLEDYEHMKNLEKDQSKDIQIRCFRLEASYERSEISWPDEVIGKVNGRRVVETYGLLKKSAVKKRKDNSYSIVSEALADNISKQIQEYHNVRVEIEAKPHSAQHEIRRIDNDYTYLFGVYLIERIKPEQLYKKITENGLQEIQEDYISGLYEIHVPQESELAIEMITCRIQDPYTSRIMELPVRGSNCQHAQCFDLKSHLGFIWASRIRTWKCPVCSKETRQFKVDRQQLELIQRTKLNGVIPEEVIFYRGEIFFKVDKRLRDRLWMESSESQNCKDESRNSKGERKKEYVFLHYHPVLEMTQVSFTPQLLFNKPKRSPKINKNPFGITQSTKNSQKKSSKKRVKAY